MNQEDITHDKGYGTIKNIIKKVLLENMSEDDEKIYRKYLKEKDGEQYIEFVEWEKGQ